MRVTSPLIPAASSAASRVFRDSSRRSVSGSAVPEAALSEAALSEAALSALLAAASVSKLSTSPGWSETGSPP